jgi:hypothetical protein
MSQRGPCGGTLMALASCVTAPTESSVPTILRQRFECRWTPIEALSAIILQENYTYAAIHARPTAIKREDRLFRETQTRFAKSPASFGSRNTWMLSDALGQRAGPGAGRCPRRRSAVFGRTSVAPACDRSPADESRSDTGSTDAEVPRRPCPAFHFDRGGAPAFRRHPGINHPFGPFLWPPPAGTPGGRSRR